MLHACAERFDVTENLENILIFGWTKQGPSIGSSPEWTSLALLVGWWFCGRSTPSQISTRSRPHQQFSITHTRCVCVGLSVGRLVDTHTAAAARSPRRAPHALPPFGRRHARTRPAWTWTPARGQFDYLYPAAAIHVGTRSLENGKVKTAAEQYILH